MELTQDEIAEIQRLLEASPYDELTIETARVRLTLRRGEGGLWIQEAQTLSEPVLISPVSQETALPHIRAREPTSAATREGLVNIYPPLPGAFYRAPKPGAEPFVEVGSLVNEDSVVGIIETMKLMNPVPAGTEGKVVEICAANGEQVDTTHVLMRVDPQEGGRA